MKRNTLLSLVLALTLLVAIGIRFAEPLADGDLFWQMAYGKYMLEHHTPVPDPLLYSWTPCSSQTVYCAWIAELMLYLAYRLGGYVMLFALRYLVVGAVVLLLFDLARRARVKVAGQHNQAGPEVYLYALILLLASYVGTIVKPELFSLLFFSLLAWGYFRMKLEAREGQPDSGWFWYFPLLMLVWVNTHGVFMFGLLAQLTACLGEWLNLLLSPRLALTVRDLRRFTGSTLGAVAACFVTPYGWRYPGQLLAELRGMVGGTQSLGDVIAYATNAAHQSIFTVTTFHFVPLLVIMAAVLLGYFVVLFRRGKSGGRLDFAVLLLNLMLGALYVWYLRTTYYWPAFFGYSCLYMGYLGVNSGPDPLWDRALTQARRGAVALFIALAGLSCYQAICWPHEDLWCGFGISLYNPVYEAEWIARFDPQARIYNDYDDGGYLLWRLSPLTRVMIDSRSFPYRGWYQAYDDFETGRKFHEFLDQLPRCDLAVISIKNQALWESFLKSGEWRLCWMGPVAGVYCRTEKKYPLAAADFGPDRFDSMRNLEAGVLDFQFAMTTQRYDEAFAIVRALSRNLGYSQRERQTIKALVAVKAALEADKLHPDADKALLLYEECARQGVLSNPDRLLSLYNWKMGELQKHNQHGENAAEITDLAVRLQAVHEGKAPPLPAVSPSYTPPPASKKSPAEDSTPPRPAITGAPTP